MMNWYQKKGIDHETKMAVQRAMRKANGNAATHIYEKQPHGFLMRLYRNMLSRITGVQKTKFHLYRNLTILDKESFYKWAHNSTAFYLLYADWVRSGYNRKLTPSVDRIDSRKGYELSNMEWITFEENSRRGGFSKKNFHKRHFSSATPPSSSSRV